MEQEKLRRLEEKCIQDCAPPCTAACPVHVDVRSLTGHIARGDFSAALKLLRKTLPFPTIIGSICDQPCRSHCNRSLAGGSIEIAALERACAFTADTPAPKILVLPARDKRVAIVGGGLGGLTAAFDLRKKGYAVTVFEAAGSLGGSIRKVGGERLTPECIEGELAVLEAIGVEVELHTKADVFNLPDFDAVFAAPGAAGGSQYLPVDPITYATAREGLFAGGSLLRDAYSPILSVADGRRAAISIDRYLQNVSLTASRAGEGSLQSCLYTNMGSVKPAIAPPRSPNGFTIQEAVQEADRCLQCECLECVKVCRYLEAFGSYPKKYIRETYNNLSIVMGVRQSNALINSCSLCGLCAEVCPKGLDMGSVMSDARRIMIGQKRMPPSAHDFALRDMLFANSDASALCIPAPGKDSCEYLFFPGCQLSASAPEHVEKTYALLRDTFSADVGLMLGCCGAPADWAGRDDLLKQVLDDFSVQHRRMGSPRLILACPSCSRVFRRYLPEVETVSLWEVLEKSGAAPVAAPAREHVLSIHDPCSARNDGRLHESVRIIVTNFGYTIKELPLSRQKTTCCSYGGLMWFANAKVAREVIDRRIRESGDDYLTYCSMCRDLFASQGKRCLHLLDLLFENDVSSSSSRACPGWSQRRENRVQLKRRILTKLTGEVMTDDACEHQQEFFIAADVQAVLEQRFILAEDIRQVIAQAEQTGRKLVNPETGSTLAYHKLGCVTYWVEYSSTPGGAFSINNAYSHRMEIIEGVKS